MQPDADTFHFTADKGDARLRLDQILVRRVTDVSRLSRTAARQWIDAGAVKVDGAVAIRPATRVREGARIAVALPASAARRERPAAEDTALDIVFEDEHLLVINKPAGVVVHPSYKQTSGTVLNAVLGRLRARPDAAPPGIVTRLDKDTSGLVLIALTPAVHATVQRDAAAGRVEKRYLAIVDGVPRPANGRIRLPIGRDPDDRRRMIVTTGGAASETLYEVSGTATIDGQRCAMVTCTLVTGRTHQIRVHMAAQHCAVLGDRVYGRSHPAIARQALHAWTLALPHPVTREPLLVEAPLPADMQQLAAWYDASSSHHAVHEESA